MTNFKIPNKIQMANDKIFRNLIIYLLIWHLDFDIRH